LLSILVQIRSKLDGIDEFIGCWSALIVEDPASA
jgi:hypothetical protein